MLKENAEKIDGAFSGLPLDLYSNIFQFFSMREQLKDLFIVSKTFRRAVIEKTLPKFIDSFKLDSLLSDPVFKKHPINLLNLAHALSLCDPEFVEKRLNTTWSIAAVAGNTQL